MRLVLVALLGVIVACGGHAPAPPPPPPVHGVVVSLTPASDSVSVDHFIIYRDPVCPATTAFATTVLKSYTDKTAVFGQPYCYAAKAIGMTGLASSGSVSVKAVWH